LGVTGYVSFMYIECVDHKYTKEGSNKAPMLNLTSSQVPVLDIIELFLIVSFFFFFFFFLLLILY